jgi:3-oxoacyl-(acyl-carrier-protein) synthase/NAD(P)-dependent dehydrogenase (short-subunit alcohol dehydrogenase family)
MAKKILAIDSFDDLLSTTDELNQIEVTNISSKDIAIIGFASRLEDEQTSEGFWKTLVNGKNTCGQVSDERKKDVEQYLNNRQQFYKGNFVKGSFFKSISNFDYNFFGFSPKEASLLDPNQRFFLETVWTAIENAGYAGKRIKSTNTGVFVGYSQDFGQNYRSIIHTNDLDAIPMSLAGNIESIIASRISYFLDLKGPAMMIDTACSSSLVAIYQACRSLQNHECEMALAGGVKLHLVPLQSDNKDGVGFQSVTGIISSDNIAKTFDDSSDGTGIGEGVGVILLKPLNKALQDGDNIHAVIKGGAVNQDGSSIGITAPNADAQTALLTKAWQDAGISPETISYIETHGTGTKLGDPIEIRGIENAFKKFTSKKQFCGVGSVKANIGHLDNVAGVSGLIKLILSLKNKTIPATLFFQKPNRNINFIDSPVYVCDKNSSWESENIPLRAGISSFGLSGTNCHLIIEESPLKPQKKTDTQQPQLLVISAMTLEGLKALIESYKTFFRNTTEDISDVCFTAATGREHFNYRITIIADNQQGFLSKLNHITDFENIQTKGFGFGKFKVLNENNTHRNAESISMEEQMQISTEANKIAISALSPDHLLEQLSLYYLKGATIDWGLFFRSSSSQKIEIPTYIFQKNRCWVDSKQNNINKGGLIPDRIHPLIDRLIEKSEERIVYQTNISIAKHWEIREHIVRGTYVLPGTSYLEMVFQAVKHSGIFEEAHFSICNAMFIQPLVIINDESVDVTIELQKSDKNFKYIIFTENNLEKIIFTEGEIHPQNENPENIETLENLMNQFSEATIFDNKLTEFHEVKTSERWNCTQELRIGQDEFLAIQGLPACFDEDSRQYFAYPSLLDCAANVANIAVGEGLYLPFSYKKIQVFKPIRGKIFTYLKKNPTLKTEVISLDIKIFDESGILIALIDDYYIKKVHQQQLSSLHKLSNCYEIKWLSEETKFANTSVDISENLYIHVMSDPTISNALRTQGARVIDVELASQTIKLTHDSYRVENSEEGFRLFLSNLDLGNYQVGVIHSIANSGDIFCENIEVFKQQKDLILTSAFNLVKGILNSKVQVKNNLIFLTQNAHRIDENECVFPFASSMVGFAKAITQEYESLNVRCIDWDDITSNDLIINEIVLNRFAEKVISFRKNQRLLPELGLFKSTNLVSNPITLTSDGVYVISGGTGSLALALVHHWALKNKINVVLLNRNGLPEIHKTDDFSSINGSNKSREKIEKIQQIAESGTHIECHAIDITDFSKMEQLFNNLRQKFGKINGIVHTAGVAGDGFLLNKSLAKFNEVLAPKLEGTFILDKLTQEDNLDFFISYSSITSVFGAVGQSDYSAGNAFLDGFTSNFRENKTKYLSINWSAWAEIGMAYDFQAIDEKSPIKAIGTQKALGLFDEIFSFNIQNVVVAEWNYQQIGKYPSLLGWLPKGERQKAHKEDNNASNLAVKVLLVGKESNEITQIEHTIGGLWYNVLGLEEIDVYDNFYNVGGDSISATFLLKEFEKVYPNMVEVADIFTYCTIHEMGQFLENKLNKPKKPIPAASESLSDIDNILAMLTNGELSLEKANQLIEF